jgi:diguanylate cyclase (GGDEF)-like protein
VILDALREAIAPAATGDEEAEPQQGAQQPDPGAELRRLAQQYSGKSKDASDGLVEKGNVDLTNRPRVTNPDRSTSTVRSMSFEQDGREILVPTVSDDGRIMSNDEAIQQYRKTGKHLGIFRDVASANAYAKSLHEQQAGTLSDSTDPGVALRKLAVQSTLRPEVPAAQAPSVSRQPPVTEPGPFAEENAKAFDQTPAPAPEEPKPGILSRIKKTIADALSEQPDQGYGAEARPTAPTRTGLRAPGKPAPETTAAQELGLNEKGLTGRVVNALGDAAANPIKTAAGLAWAPVKAAITLDKASAELETRNTIAQAGGDPNSVAMTVTPKEAAIAAAQLGSLALGPEFEALLGRVAAPFIGTVANVAGSRAAAVAGRAAAIGTRGAVGAGAGAVFSPDDPAVGAILGGAAGAAHAAASGATVEPRRIALQEPEGANLAGHPDRLLASRERPKPSATARVEPEAAAPGGDESPFTVESTNTPGEALAELARRYKKGTDVTPGATPSAPAATPSGPLAALSEALRAARMKTAEVIAPELGAERRAANRAATTDAMTGLGNQRAYEGAVKAAEADPKTSVIRFDLNGFKNVNDVHGHEAGDAALKSVASVIREHAKGLPAFRVGGDEFALFAPAADAARVRDAIEQAVGVRVVHDASKTIDNLQSGGKPAIAKYSISGGIGETNAAADADAIARKAEHKKAQGIAGRTEAAPSASSVRSEPVANIDVEPERFQYKLNTNEKGVGRELESVKKWNPDLAGVIGVWRDPVDGRLKVINGHHRLDLAQRNNVQNVDVREINAPDAKTARATGAIINIAEGRGTAVDAAKMFRDTQMSPADLEQRGVSLTGQVAKEGLALSKLHPKIFDDVVAGRMPVQRAAVIGNAGLEPEQQLALTNMLEQREAKGRKMPNDAIAELVRFVKEAGSESTTQESLFGEEQMTQSLAPEKAELSAWVKEKLGKDRRLFGFLTKGGRAEHIEGAGVGKIETQRAEALATDAAQAEEVYNKLSTMSGPISDALNHAAREWVRGGERGAIRTQLYEAVSNAVRASVGDAEGPRGGGVPSAPERHEAAGHPGEAGEASPGAAPVERAGNALAATPKTYELRDLLDMPASEIERIADAETATEKNVETELFGAEGAKRYAAAQMTVNSPMGHLNVERYDAAGARIEQMEGSLTDAQRNRLFGIGQKGLNAEELRDAARAARDYAPENASDIPDPILLTTVGRELTTGSPTKDAASALRLRGASAELQRRSGASLSEIIRDALDERVARGFVKPDDAVQLLAATLSDLKRAGFFTESIEPNTPSVDEHQGGLGFDRGPRRLSEGKGYTREQLKEYERIARDPDGAEAKALEKDEAIKAFGSQRSHDALATAIEMLRAYVQPSSRTRLAEMRAAQMRKPWVDLRGQRLGKITDLHKLLQVYRHPGVERVHVVMFNENQEIVSHTVQSSGAISFIKVDLKRWAEEIIARAKRLGISEVVIAHNHPSGDPTPSGDDATFTGALGALLQDRGISLLGHLVIDHEEGTWLAPRGSGQIAASSFRVPDAPAADWATAYERDQPRVGREQVAQLVRDSAAENGVTAFYLDTQARVVAVESRVASSAASVPRWLGDQLRAHGARYVILSAPHDAAQQIMRHVQVARSQAPAGREMISHQIAPEKPPALPEHQWAHDLLDIVEVTPNGRHAPHTLSYVESGRFSADTRNPPTRNAYRLRETGPDEAGSAGRGPVHGGEGEAERVRPPERVTYDATSGDERDRAARGSDEGGRRTGEPAPGGFEYRSGRPAGARPIRSGEGTGGREERPVRGELPGADAEQLDAAELFRREMEKRGRKVPDRRAVRGYRPPPRRDVDENLDDDLPPAPDQFAPATQRARLAKTTIVDDAGEPLVVYYHTSSPSDDPKLQRQREDYNAPHLRRPNRPSGPPTSHGWTYEKARRAMIDSGRWSDADLTKLEKTLAEKQRYRPAYKGIDALVHVLEREQHRYAGKQGYQFHPTSWWKQFEGLVDPPPGLDRPLGIRLRGYNEVVDVRDFGGPVIKHGVHVNIERPLRFPDGGATRWTYETVRAAMIRSEHWTDQQVSEWEKTAAGHGVRTVVDGKSQQVRLYGIDALRALIKRPSADRFGARFGGHPKGFDGIVFRNPDEAPGSAELQLVEDEALRRFAAQSDDKRLEQYYHDARDRRVEHQKKNAVDSWVALDDEQIYPAVPLGERPAAPPEPRNLGLGKGNGPGRRPMTEAERAAWQADRADRVARGEDVPRLGRPPRLGERDLFGEESDEVPTVDEEPSLFGSNAGTAASRNLKETERAARAELEKLRVQEQKTTSPVQRVKLARRISELEKLVNRDQKIGANELARRARADDGRLGEPPPPIATGAPARKTHPMPEPTGTGIRQSSFRPFDLVRKIKSVFIPEALGPDARGAAGTIRHEGAQRFRAYTQAAEALRELRAHIEKLPRDRQVEVWDDYENGRDTGDAFIDGANKVFRQVTEERTNELIRLDRLKAERAIINYIGRFWSIENGPKKAANLLRTIFGKRPFEGPKSFLKQRSLEHFVEGLDAGLVPATYNYVESQLAKIAEMERLIGAEHMLQAEQKQGRAKPILNGHDVPEDADGEKWVKIDREGNDPAFTIWGPPEVTHWEGVDAMVYGKLQKLIQDLRIRHERKLKIGQGLGYARRAPEEMVTKFGGPEGTIMHELGHILDFRYNFKRLLAEGIGKAPTRTVKKGKRVGAAVPDYKNESPQARARRKQLREELRNLANLRRETLAGVPDTKNLSKADRAYLHSWPEKAANMVEAYIGARDRFRQVAPGIFEIFDAIVEDHPELHPLRDIRPSLSRETHAVVERLPGPVVAGHWYAPRNAAAVWQNHLSKGMRGNPIYDAVTAPGVAATQILLGISGFHGTVIATEGMFSDMVLAAEQLLSGKPLASAKALGRVVGSPVTSAISSRPFRTKREASLAFGAKVMQEYRKPGSHPELATVLEAMIAGGFRGTEKSELWTGERVDALKRAFRQAVHNDSKVLRAWNASKIPFDAIYAGVELISAPLMSRYVPLMKTAAVYHAVAKRLDELPPNLADGRLEREMWDIVKEMDYRFGQVIYDNHFINAVAKHLAQALFMAPGWTFGTLALMARGTRDVAVAPKRIYDRATGKPGAKERPILGRSGKYWVAAVVGTMLLNGLLTYFNTGTMPGDGEDGDWWKDFFAFRDGTYDINGNANRHTIPGYLMHDVYGWTHHQYDTFLNKLNPFFSFAASVVRNQGRFGEMIRDPDGSPAEQARDVGAAAVKNFSPLSVQNYLEGRTREETGASELTRNAFGVNPAKREVVRSDAQNRMAEYLSRRGRSTPTPDEAEARTDRARILSGARVGADVSDRITTAIERGELTVPQLTRLMKRVGILPLQEQFKSLTIKQALDVFDRATPREQGLLLDILQKKIANSGRAP